MNESGSKGSSRIVRAIWIGLAIVGLAVLSWLLLTAFLPTYLGWSVYDYAVDRIVDASGWNRLLVQSVALLLLLPFVWAVAETIRIGFVARVRDAWRGSQAFAFRKRAAATLLVAYASAFFALLYVAGRDSNFSFSTGQAVRYYALTPEGIRLFSEAGTDPKYGIELRPITPEIAESVERQQQGVRPEAIAGDQLATYDYFDGNTGRARAWFVSAPDGGYELFSSAGFHPQYGEPLRPVTAQIVETLLARLEGDRAEAAEAAAAAQAAATARAAAERGQRQADEQAALRRRYLGNGSPAGTWLAVAREGKPDLAVAGGLQSTLANISLLGDAFVTDGAFSRLQQGDIAILEQLGMGQGSRVILVAVTTSSTENEVGGERVQRCMVTLTVRSLQPASGTPVVFDVAGTGVGFDAASAERQAIERATAEVANRLR